MHHRCRTVNSHRAAGKNAIRTSILLDVISKDKCDCIFNAIQEEGKKVRDITQNIKKELVSNNLFFRMIFVLRTPSLAAPLLGYVTSILSFNS